jgi:diaminopropionate ammonia-lyase
VLFGDRRPFFVVVDPSRAACIVETARAGHPVKVDHGEATVMAMLECYEPSLVAWRILSHAADAFMTVDDPDAIDAMKLLASPRGADPAVVAGESGGVGLAALLKVAADPGLRTKIGLDTQSRVFLINTEGATDPVLYEKFVGATPADIAAKNSGQGGVKEKVA